MTVRNALVIDDDPVLRELFSFVLRDEGIDRILFAANGKEAVELLRSNRQIEFITLDLNMPACDGIEFLRLASHISYSGRIVLVSSEPEQVRISAARLAGMLGLHCQAILGKPVDFAAIAQLLREPPVVALRRLSSEVSLGQLEDALADGRIEAVYQPKMDLQCNRLVGGEALVRIYEADGRLLNTESAIGIAEKHGLISGITWRMIELICHDLTRFLRVIDQKLRLSFNVSGHVLDDAGFVSNLLRCAQVHGLRPQSLTLEITETALPEDQSVALEQLTRARLLGFGVAVDDFGSGYSNISQMQQYPFTELKIDKEFLLRMEQDRFARAALEAGAMLGREMGLLVVAEGVETLQSMQIAREAGINEGQGYLFSKPLPPEDFIERCRELQAWVPDTTNPESSAA